MGREDIIRDVLELSRITAVSSAEGGVAAHVRERFDGSPWELDVDLLGNVVLRHPSWAEGRQTLLLFAHMDEIGMIVRKIEPDGFLRFERLGGVNTQVLPGSRVVIQGASGALPGVIGVQAHHFMPPENKFAVPPVSELYIDAFVSSADEARGLGIEVGTLVGLEGHAELVRDSYLSGKSMDNRAAMSVLYDLADELGGLSLPYNLAIAFPVMEEFNIRGLMPVIHSLRPTLSVGLDVTPSCDTPDLDYNDVRLGAGPAICCMNFHGGGTLAGVLPNRELFDSLLGAAQGVGVTLQREVAPGVITENAFALFENDGVRVACLSIPTRYTHTDNETVSVDDLVALRMVLGQFCVSDAVGLLPGNGDGRREERA